MKKQIRKVDGHCTESIERFLDSVADPDPGSGAFLTPVSGSMNG